MIAGATWCLTCRRQPTAFGYAAMDSSTAPRSRAPGRQLNLTATPAPNEASAAQYYPAIYWYSMLRIPPPISLAAGVRILRARLQQRTGSTAMKNNGCVGCHQLGQLSTRTIPDLAPHPANAPKRGGSACSRDSRARDARPAHQPGRPAFTNFGDWTDRIAKGELPHAKPPRPQGVERNIVVTLRDWMNEKTTFTT